MKPHLLIVATLALGLARVIAILAALALGVGGCGQAEEPGSDPQAFRSVVGSPDQVAHATATLDVFRNLVNVDASRVDVVFVNTWEEQRDACHGFAGCTDPETNGYHVTTYWPLDWTEAHPYILAHELCHVYYFQTGDGYGDHNHTHIECFDRQTGFAAEAAMIVVGASRD